MDLKEYIRTHPPNGFKPVPYHNAIGNLVEWYWAKDRAYEDPVRVDGVHVGSLMRSMATHEPVGVKIFLSPESQ